MSRPCTAPMSLTASSTVCRAAAPSDGATLIESSDRIRTVSHRRRMTAPSGPGSKLEGPVLPSHDTVSVAASVASTGSSAARRRRRASAVRPGSIRCGSRGVRALSSSSSPVGSDWGSPAFRPVLLTVRLRSATRSRALEHAVPGRDWVVSVSGLLGRRGGLWRGAPFFPWRGRVTLRQLHDLHIESY